LAADISSYRLRFLDWGVSLRAQHCEASDQVSAISENAVSGQRSPTQAESPTNAFSEME
jgi:hypothetical protein